MPVARAVCRVIKILAGAETKRADSGTSATTETIIGNALPEIAVIFPVEDEFRKFIFINYLGRVWNLLHPFDTGMCLDPDFFQDFCSLARTDKNCIPGFFLPAGRHGFLEMKIKVGWFVETEGMTKTTVARLAFA